MGPEQTVLRHSLIWIFSVTSLTFLHSEWPKLIRVLAVLSAIGLMKHPIIKYMDRFLSALRDGSVS